MSSPSPASGTMVSPRVSAYTGPSFTFGNRFARVVWKFFFVLFFRFTPRPLHAWRTFLLRCFGAKIGHGCHIYPNARIWAPWNLRCGNEVGIADDVILYNQAPITLGDRVVVSQGSYLCTGTHNYNSPKFELVACPINVEAHAWICAEVFVHPGVLIREGAVIGARSVVTRDMPAWTVCTGHPCAPVKPRDRIA